MNNINTTILLTIVCTLSTQISFADCLNREKSHALCQQKKNGGWKCQGPLQTVSYGKQTLEKALNGSGCPGGKSSGSSEDWQIYQCKGKINKRSQRILEKIGISFTNNQSDTASYSDAVSEIISHRPGKICGRNTSITMSKYFPKKQFGVIRLNIESGYVILKIDKEIFPQEGDVISGRQNISITPQSTREFEIYVLSMLEQGCDQLDFKHSSSIINLMKGELRKKIMESEQGYRLFGDQSSSIGCRG